MQRTEPRSSTVSVSALSQWVISPALTCFSETVSVSGLRAHYVQSRWPASSLTPSLWMTGTSHPSHMGAVYPNRCSQSMATTSLPEPFPQPLQFLLLILWICFSRNFEYRCKTLSLCWLPTFSSSFQDGNISLHTYPFVYSDPIIDVKFAELNGLELWIPWSLLQSKCLSRKLSKDLSYHCPTSSLQQQLWISDIID